MSFNLIKVIENLGCLTKVTKLYLVQNKVSKIEGLQNLSQLEMVELGANKIRVRNLGSFKPKLCLHCLVFCSCTKQIEGVGA